MIHADHTFSFYELGLPNDDPVYTLKKVMEELDFSGLLACYSDQGRTGYNPIMLYCVITYANMRGVRAVDRIVDLCQRDIAFIWLTKGQKPQRDAFYDFKGKKISNPHFKWGANFDPLRGISLVPPKAGFRSTNFTGCLLKKALLLSYVL